MRLCDALKGLDYSVICGSENCDITFPLSSNRDKDKIAGSLFCCIAGARFDAHSIIDSLVESGAAAIVVEQKRAYYKGEALKSLIDSLNGSVAVVETSDTRLAYAWAESNFAGNPQQRLINIGITGTKGKTTTAFLTRYLLDFDSENSMMIGTNGAFIGKNQEETARTTPEPADLYKLIGKGADCGMRSLVMEVSSLALKQYRVANIDFKYALFTNLYRDHIGNGEHADMDEYFKCKLMIFNQCKNAIINADMERSQEALEYVKYNTTANLYTYGLTENCVCRAVNLRVVSREGVMGTCFEIVSPWYNGEVFLGLPGEFNVYNALCAATVAGLEQVSFEHLKEVLAEAEIPGRVQIVKNKLAIDIRVDYAHNGASLEALLKSMREYTGGKIISVFGCGGDRSRERRQPMGEAAALYSDYTVITTDNSRSENPNTITEDIVQGFKMHNIGPKDNKYEIELDRRVAIEKAIRKAQTGDMILIVGKGHEQTQTISVDVTIPFNDVEIARELSDKIYKEQCNV